MHRARVEIIDDAIDSAATEHLTGPGDPRESARADPEAVRRLVQAGPWLTRRTLVETMVFEELDLDAGLAAAAAFGGVRPLPAGTALGYRVGPPASSHRVD